jgi:hypothetical protein
MNRLHDLAARCEQDILKNQLPSGGWGFGTNRQWATEPTCFALLALRLQPSSVHEPGVRLLLSCQNANGSWPAFVDDDTEGSWVTALAVLTLMRLTTGWNAVDRGFGWLLNTQGRESHWLMKWRYRFLDRNVKFQPDKYGWPWTPGSSSWVVPTAYTLIALRRYFACCMPEAVAQRVRRGVEMLFDRACPGGGWNAGNGVAFGVPLTPHPDVTALALIALRPQKHHPFIRASLDWLLSQEPEVSSLYSLSWIAISLAAFGLPAGHVWEKLFRLHSEARTGKDCQALALTHLALHAHNGPSPF